MRRTLIDTECWRWWHFSPERLGAAATAPFEEKALADAQILDYDVDVLWGGRQAPPRPRGRRRT